MKKKIKHYLLLGTAWFLLVIGLVLFISPIPIGIFFIAVGVSLLTYSSERVQQRVHDYRVRHHKLNQQLLWIEKKLDRRIKFISHSLSKTRPVGGDVK
ncbi:Pyruvate kinase [gamma proteobacterium IMCC2047]|nr:Pyruvate kinase [gamma proteobacterium IMCC2047]